MQQPALFDRGVSVKEPPKKSGKELGQLSYEKQKEPWKAAVIEFAIEIFLPRQTESFLCEDLRIEYQRYAKRKGLPNVVTLQAWAGIPVKLKTEGYIVNAGSGHRANGVRAELYRVIA